MLGTLDGFRRFWAVCVALLFLATRPLWLSNADFPQVPAIYPVGWLPSWCDGALLVMMLLALLAQFSPLWKPALGVFIAALALSIAIDQHRFQPWAYQSLLVAIVLAAASAANAASLLRWLVVGIYAYSAWSKCDFMFVHNLGQQFLTTLGGLVRLDVTQQPEGVRLALAWLFPLGELIIAIGLAVPRCWWWARWLSVAMHVALLMIFGPWGMNHQWGVLIWNIYFIGQNLLLFRPAPVTVVPRDHLAWACVLAAIVWPLGEAWGYCDHWPSWSVYSPRVERTSLFIADTDADKLPDDLQRYLTPATDDEGWLRVRLDQWSLDAMHAPLYPQNRFQLGVAAALIERYDLSRFRIVRFGVADRRTGERQSSTISTRPALDAALAEYWVNARPRRDLPPAVAAE